MAFVFVRGVGANTDPAVINLAASGVVKVNQAVDWLRLGTGGAIVGPSGSSSTSTMLFGVSLSYAQGASDTFANVITFEDGQLWQVDCANAATTAQVGIRHAISASDRAVIHNTGSDVVNQTGVFLAYAMTGATTGSGKLLGTFVSTKNPIAQSPTTWI